MSTPGATHFVRWARACAAAETVGMAAAAAAARIGQVVADRGTGSARGPALAVVVAGGLVEGAALGVLQGKVLASRWPTRSRRALHALDRRGRGRRLGSSFGAWGPRRDDDGPGRRRAWSCWPAPSSAWSRGSGFGLSTLPGSEDSPEYPVGPGGWSR